MQRRAWELLGQLQPELVRRRLEPMLAASRLRVEDPSANLSAVLPEAVLEDLAMLRRWKYDPEQRLAIAEALEQLAENR